MPNRRGVLISGWPGWDFSKIHYPGPGVRVLNKRGGGGVIDDGYYSGLVLCCI